MANGGGVIRITPKRMAAQWQKLRHRLEVNVYNFETAAGLAGVEVFKKSFDLKKFNTRGGSWWPARKNDKAKHPLLRETGTLQNSITYQLQKGTGIRSVKIFTNPSAFNGAARHPGFCYAAIHNEGGRGSGASGAAANIEQRQFIGDSTVLFERLLALQKKIFRGFPNANT